MSDGNERPDVRRLSVGQRLGALFSRRHAVPEPADELRSAEVWQALKRIEAIRDAARNGINARADGFIEH